MQNAKNNATNEKKRLAMVFGFFVLFALYICGYLFFWQVIKADWLNEQAITQWTQGTKISAKRGTIYDRSAIALAKSGTAETVVAMPKSIPEKDRERVATQISQILGLDYNDVYEKIIDQKRSQWIIKRQITIEQSEALRKAYLPGIDFAIETKRYYPLKNFAAQIIGYTSVDGNGQEGLEAKYNKYLSGAEGRVVSEIDREGRQIALGASQNVSPIDGNNIILTIDAALQTFLERAVQEALEVNNAKSVQGIIMNPKTGELLAAAVKPDFDLNSPPRNDLAALQALSRNRLVADSYEPGSTFKILTLSSGLNEGIISESSTFDCPGFRIVDGERIKCWKNSHGSQSLEKGVQNSCNPVFMDIALKLGKDKMYEYIYNFGFGQSTDSGLSGETNGIVRHKKYVQNVDLARIGFGQAVSVTPIQLVTAVSACINGGNLMKPYVVKEIVTQDGKSIEQNSPTIVRQVITESTSALVSSMLQSVVKDGSGRNAYIPGYKVGGKTGTAQKYEDGKIAVGKNVASFVGFAPADDPQFIVLILVDEPNISSQIFGSTVAAPYVRSVLYDCLKHYGIKPNYDESEAEFNDEIMMPDVRGKSLNDAIEELKSLGLEVTADGSGTILNQAPQPDAKVTKGMGILLYTTEPDKQEPEDNSITVPDVSGRKIARAYEKLKEAGLKVNAIGDPRGTIITQFPKAGERVEPGAIITITAYDESLKEADFIQPDTPYIPDE